MNSIISVIVPVYNAEKDISRCIESICNQTYRHLEVLLIDDGSTDRSGDICKRYQNADERIVYIKKDNGGQASARNVGLDHSTGDYIAFVDSDDYIEETMFSEMMSAIIDTNSDLCICGIKKTRGEKTTNICHVDQERIYTNSELMRAYFIQRIIGTVIWNKLYKAYLWSNTRFPEVRANEDAFVLHEVLFKARRAVQIPSCLYYYIIRANSTERTFSINSLNAIAAGEQRRTFVQRNYPELYDYLGFDVAGRIKRVMRLLLKSGNYWENRELYRALRNNLREECKKLNGSMKKYIDNKSADIYFANKLHFVYWLMNVRFKCGKKAK